jgi:hypothetical protein
MSNDEADALEEELKRKWDSRHRTDFFHKMERKFRRRQTGTI